MSSQTRLRSLPSVDRLVNDIQTPDLPRPVVLSLVRRELQQLRENPDTVAVAGLHTRLTTAINDLRLCRLQPVINGTGIIIHTNLGRSPLPQYAVEKLTQAAANYTNLEFDLTNGQRGSRGAYLENCLAILCQSESATVVNNCAAALVLILKSLISSTRRRVIISRGELVQIGGGFRIPEILQASGAALHETGTTNKTTLDDYRLAITSEAAMILKVHRSNFYMGGFVDSPTTQEIAAIAHQGEIPFVEDLGSGAMFDTTQLGCNELEPTPAQILSQGVDVVCFSGDKLLGGPQAGIVAGKAAFIQKLKSNPFFRALRCDKLVLSALEATVDLWLSHKVDQIPVLRMMHAQIDDLQIRAQNILAQLALDPSQVSIGQGHSQVGGGTLPRTQIPSVTLDLRPAMSLESLAERLRQQSPPLIGYIANDRFKLDLRTIFPTQDATVIHLLQSIVK